MIELYGHPFSSYTWKALIALYANDTPFKFHTVDPGHPDNTALVAAASPRGKFPVLVDGDRTVFEATAIIEHLAAFHPGPAPLIPEDPAAAVETRMIDRVFDNYVMTPMDQTVFAWIRAGGPPDETFVAERKAELDKAYRWLDQWLAGHDLDGRVSLIECAAAPSLFYADWVHPIADEFARLRDYRAYLLAMAPVKRCVDEARPFRPYFPPGAPDRD